MLEFVSGNKEWIFSGIGVTILTGIWFLIKRFMWKKGGDSQTQRSGAFSTNTQIGSITVNRSEGER